MFEKAVKEGTKLRAALFGPAGSGKTYSSLRLAKGLGKTIALIDTERRSARKYADRFAFDVCELDNRSIEGYIKAIESAKGYDVLIIDSLTHAWQELLDEVNKLADRKYRGNSWSAWSEGTPRQRSLIDCLLESPCHIIATIRSKTEWTTVNDGGKARPVRVGLAPEQGKGIEYEFDLLLELSTDNSASVIKDRSGRFQGRTIDMIDEDFGVELGEWLKDGVPPRERPQQVEVDEPPVEIETF